MAKPRYCPQCGDSHLFPCRDKPGWFKCQECGVVLQPKTRSRARALTERQTEIRFLGRLLELSQRQAYRLEKRLGPIDATIICDLDDESDRASFRNVTESYLSYYPPAGLQKLPLVPGTTDVKVTRPFQRIKLNGRHPFLLAKIPDEDSGKEFFVRSCQTTGRGVLFWIAGLALQPVTR